MCEQVYIYIYIYIYIFHIVFIHSSVNGFLGCFCVLAMVVNGAAMNIEVPVSLRITVFVFFFLNICPKMGLLDHTATL